MSGSSCKKFKYVLLMSKSPVELEFFKKISTRCNKKYLELSAYLEFASGHDAYSIGNQGRVGSKMGCRTRLDEKEAHEGRIVPGFNRFYMFGRSIFSISRQHACANKRFAWAQCSAGIRFASSSSKLRNIGIIAHIDAGKTTTTERMLYYSGLTNHIGDVDQGDTVMDYLPAERDRGITINSAAITFDWNEHKINLIDTPGHADFTFEVIRSIRVLDGAVTVLDAVAGVEAQTEKVWKQASAMGIPKIIYINKMDREGAGYGRTVKEVVSKLQTRVGIVNIPYFSGTQAEPHFSGVVDIIDQKLIVWKEGSDGKSIEASEVPENLMNDVINARTALIETLSGIDDQIVEEFLDSDGDYMTFSANAIKQALRRQTLKRNITPVLCGASFKNIGVQPLLEAVVDYLPSPDERPDAKAVYSNDVLNGRRRGKRRGESITKKVDSESSMVETTIGQNDGLTCALAFKVGNDPIRGMLVYVRVYSGTLRQGSMVYNTNTGNKERVMNIVQMQADSMIEVPAIEAGNIGVIVGSQNINTGDTLVAHPSKKDGINSLSSKYLSMRLNPIEVPPPVFFAAIEPKAVSHERGMDEALKILLREDPSLKRSFDEDTQQTLLAGMGELHLEIAHQRLQELKAKINMGKIMVSYRETITRETDLVLQESTSSGSELSNASVSVSVSPVTEDGYDDNVTAEMVMIQGDRNFVQFPAVIQQHPIIHEDEILDAIEVGAIPTFARDGGIARLPLRSINVKIHSVELSPDSTSASAVSTAIRIAADQALENLEKTDYQLMEPVMNVDVVVSEEDMGVVVKDISGFRQGQIISLGDDDAEIDTSIEGVDFKELSEEVYVPEDYTMYMSKHASRASARQSVIKAKIPLRKMTGYLTSLRAQTQGRGSFVMSFAQYQVAGRDIEAEILEDVQ